MLLCLLYYDEYTGCNALTYIFAKLLNLLLGGDKGQITWRH
jgi:hypothetical protein